MRIILYYYCRVLLLSASKCAARRGMTTKLRVASKDWEKTNNFYFTSCCNLCRRTARVKSNIKENRVRSIVFDISYSYENRGLVSIKTKKIVIFKTSKHNIIIMTLIYSYGWKCWGFFFREGFYVNSWFNSESITCSHDQGSKVVAFTYSLW